jgi:hypothetical protein
MFQIKVVEKIKTNILRSVRTIYEIMLKNLVGPDSPQVTTLCMRVACWIIEATREQTHTRTHTQKYVIRFVFPLPKWFRESASMLHYTYIPCLVSC